MHAAAFAVCLAALACSDDPAAPPTPVAGIRFRTTVSDFAAGVPSTLTVELLDSAGVVANGARNQVTLSVSAGPAFVGPTTVAANDGVATFPGLVLTTTANDLVITATSGSVTAASNPFRVVAGPPDGARTTVTPSLASLVPDENTPLVFTLRDKHDNVAAAVPISLATTVNGLTFTPATGTTGVDGTFATVARATASGTGNVTVTTTGAPVTLAVSVSVCTFAAFALPGSVSGTLGTNSCMAGGRPTALYRFVTTIPTGVAFTPTSAFSPRLEVRTDPVTPNIVLSPPHANAAEWLLPAGSYQVRLGAGANGTGAFTLNGALVPANTGCKPRFLVKAGTYTGQRLASGDCDLGDGTFFDEFAIHSVYPCGFTLKTTAFTSYMYIYNFLTRDVERLLGGDNIGVDLHMGLPSCQTGGQAISAWMNTEFGETGGPYTLVVTLTGPATISLGGRASAMTPQELASSPAVARILAFKDSVRKARRR